MNKFLSKLLLIGIFALTLVQADAQCPIVDDTFYIDNDGNPAYVNYLRKATNQTLRTTPYTGYANTPYAWANPWNVVVGHPAYNIEFENRHYTNGATDYESNVSLQSNLTQLTPGVVAPGTYRDMGQYPNPSSPVTGGINDKVVKLIIPTNYYGWASFDYNYQSCYPYTWYDTYCYQCCAGGTYSTYTNSSIYTGQVYSFISTYTCTYYGGVCSSYSYVTTGTTYTYGPYLSYVCTTTNYCCVGYNYYTNYYACAPYNSPARTTCAKKIYLYVRAPLDIVLTKACSKSNYAADELVKFTINVSSPLYSEVVDSGIVTDILPPGLNLVSYTTNGGNYDPTTGIWTLPKIGDGKSFTMTIAALATETKTYTNTASFKFLLRKDKDSTNNTMSCSFNATASTKASIKPPYPCANPIVGTTPVCPDSSGIVFGVTPVTVPGTTYTWTVPAGYTILSGQGTSSITVKTGNKAGIISANIFIPATSTTSSTTCERSFPVTISTVNSDIRIKKP